MAEDGYTYEEYTAESEDGWFLTLFRVTGDLGSDQAPDDDKLPVLIQHGAEGSAHDWFAF